MKSEKSLISKNTKFSKFALAVDFIVQIHKDIIQSDLKQKCENSRSLRASEITSLIVSEIFQWALEKIGEKTKWVN